MAAERQLDRESRRAEEADLLLASSTGSSLKASAWLLQEPMRLLATPPVCSLVRSCSQNTGMKDSAAKPHARAEVFAMEAALAEYRLQSESVCLAA